MTSWIGRGLVFALAAALISASSAPASADYYYRGGPGPGFAAGVAAGVIGLGILGAAASERAYYDGYYDGYYGANCRPGPVECRTYDAPCFHNEYGDYICPAPERRCFRRSYCD